MQALQDAQTELLGAIAVPWLAEYLVPVQQSLTPAELMQMAGQRAANDE